MTEPARPAGITAYLRHLAADTGLTPTATHLDGNRWRVVLDSDRVRCTVDLKTYTRGRLQQVTSTLTVDGRPEPLAASYPDLLALFANPDDPDVAKVEPPLTRVDPTTAPPPVRKAYAQVAARLKTMAGVTILVLNGGRRWSVQVQHDRFTLGINYRTFYMLRTRPADPLRTEPDRANKVTLIVDDEDVSEDVNGQLDRALHRIAATVTAEARPAVSGPAPSAVTSTGVQVRNTHVIRN